jgi:hypothetical protein
MAKWAHSDVLDNGLAYIKANCNSVAAVLAYTAGDAYATVMGAANIIAQTAMANGDFTLASSGNDRTLTTAAGKQDTSANNTGDPSHIAFVDTVNSKVLWVTSESSVQTVTAGNPVTFPSLVYTSQQPV